MMVAQLSFSTYTFPCDMITAEFNKPPYNGFTILPPKFDRWLAGKAEEV